MNPPAFVVFFGGIYYIAIRRINLKFKLQMYLSIVSKITLVVSQRLFDCNKVNNTCIFQINKIMSYLK